jgi:hypothetical protein
MFVDETPPDRILRWAPLLPIILAGDVIVAAIAWFAISLLLPQ